MLVGLLVAGEEWATPHSESHTAPVVEAGWDAEEEEVIAHLAAPAEADVDGRKAWVKAHSETRGMWKGDDIYGTIGVGGKLDLSLCRIGGDAKITDDIGWRVYVE